MMGNSAGASPQPPASTKRRRGDIPNSVCSHALIAVTTTTNYSHYPNHYTKVQYYCTFVQHYLGPERRIPQATIIPASCLSSATN